MPNVVLEARSVTKTYSEGVPVPALRGVDLAVERGTLVAIVGPSGSGKSTMLYTLGALESPTTGQVLLEGTDFATLADDERTLLRRRKIGFIFQDFNLLPIYTAEENVALPLRLAGTSAREANRKAREMLVDFEGFPTYGGMAGYSMEALAQGIRECIDDNWIAYRIGQTRYLGELLHNGGIPIVSPVGGHAVFIDAKKFLPHVPQEQFPAQALASAIYLHSGVRTMERGIASAGRDRKTGKQHAPELELVRLTIPRRVYTQSHMDYVADKIIELHEMRDRINGLEITWEPAAGSLRFFLMRFSPRGGELIR
jgi:ABC-type oligopeptide transport system ATPase subunit